MRALILAGLALIAGCGPRPAPKPLSLRLLDMKALEPMPYVESPMFSVHYYVFQDQPGHPWGEGKVLAAYWRKDLGFESELGGLGAARTGVLALERTKKGQGPRFVLRLNGDGAVVSSAAYSGFFDEFRVLRSKDRDLFAARSYDSAAVADAGAGPLWSPGGDVDCIAPADLDGDGYDELLTHERSGALAAYDASGKRLWRRAGLPEPRETAVGRLEGIGPAVVLRGGRFGGPPLTVLDGRGRVVASTPAAHSEALFMAVASGRLVSIGHLYPEERDYLALGPAAGAPEWRVDLGWTAVSSLAAVDLDGDGRDEIALGTTNGWVAVYSDGGKLLAEKNFLGEVSHLVPAELGGRRSLLVAVKGIPPQIFAVGVVPDPGPWKQ